MREIKFRVWDKINKEFSNHTNRDPFMDLSMGDIFYWERQQNEDGVYEGDIILKDENKNRFVLQQYTELKDSSGKEIYEGDIIENESFIGEVVFQQGSFYIKKIISKKMSNIEAIYWDKIIGNIFELPCNPDHNYECLVCNCWSNECSFKKIS